MSNLPDEGRSSHVRAWVGRDALARARTPGPSGPGFERDYLLDAIRSWDRDDEMYLTRDGRDTHWCWRIWNQRGQCFGFRMTHAR